MRRNLQAGSLLGLTLLSIGTQSASAAVDVDKMQGLQGALLSLFGIGFLLWFIGNLLTAPKLDSTPRRDREEAPARFR